MKYYLSILTIFFSFCTKITASKILWSTTLGYNVESSKKCLAPFWMNDSIPHNSDDYIKKYEMSIATEDGIYNFNFFRQFDKELIEDLNTFGDVFFSMIDVTYQPNDNNPDTGVKDSFHYNFKNDNLWFKFNYWSFGAYTNHTWTMQEDIVAYDIKMNPNCHALVLRGMRDSIDPTEVTIFVLYKGQVKVVYNKNIEIDKITKTPNETIFDVAEVHYDSNGNLKTNSYKICINNDNISIKGNPAKIRESIQ